MSSDRPEPSEPFERVHALYERACALPPEERPDFLQEECDDPAIREEVRSLLAAREEAESFLSTLSEKVLDPLKAEADPDEAIQSQELIDRDIGSYRLVEEIGVGGMSVVYRADRTEGFEQTVAVKLLQRQFESEDAERRFRTERQVLASLDHPNIASLVGGGVTEGGRPYLVMEYVDGVPITTYADTHGLGIQERLDLLQQVFDAVQAAHRQLIVHRDLKPSNVLVTETESGPQVKLLDFGIAKLLDEALPVTRPETRTGQHLMTPEYATPEQVTGREITTETDVYQLGVLAYELLSGERPLELDGQSLSEIERAVQEDDPDAPSRRATGNIPEEWGQDLDTIVLKALRKEPQRRYRSVEALAVDIARYRSGKPIEARPATLQYRARKFISRNRTAVGAGLAIGLLIVAYAVTVTVQANRLEAQRDQARTQAAKAEQVSDFLVNLISTTDPYKTGGEGGKDLTMSTVLERGANRVGQLDDQPAVQAELRNLIGRIYDKLGAFENAEPMLKAALDQRRRLHEGPDSTIATTLYNLGLHYQLTGDYKRADSLLRDALAMRRDVFGSDHPKVATILGRLGSISWYNLGNYAVADSLLHEALRIQRTAYDSAHVGWASSLNNLANLHHRQGEYTEAASYYRKAIEMYRRLEGKHPSLATIMSNFAALLRDRGRYAEADTIQRRALAIHRRQAGEESVDVALRMASLGRIRMMRGRLVEADSLLVGGMQQLQAFYEAPHPYLARTQYHIGRLRLRQDQLGAARRRFRTARKQINQSLPPGHPVRANPLLGLGRLHMQQGRPGAAEPLFREALSLRQKAFSEDNWMIAVAEMRLGRSLMRLGEHSEARPLLASAHETLREKRPEDGPYREMARRSVDTGGESN